MRRAGRLEQWRHRRERERRDAEVVRAVRERTVPLYGLPGDWEGLRALSGWGYSKASGLTSVGLKHTIGGGAKAATIDVRTYWVVAGGIEDVQDDVEHEFDLRDPAAEPTGLLEWMRMRIPVDGVSTDFRVIAGRSAQWGAAGEVGRVVVAVVVSNFAMADVVLETVTDVDPYIAGWQELRKG